MATGRRFVRQPPAVVGCDARDSRDARRDARASLARPEERKTKRPTSSRLDPAPSPLAMLGMQPPPASPASLASFFLHQRDAPIFQAEQVDSILYGCADERVGQLSSIPEMPRDAQPCQGCQGCRDLDFPGPFFCRRRGFSFHPSFFSKGLKRPPPPTPHSGRPIRERRIANKRRHPRHTHTKKKERPYHQKKREKGKGFFFSQKSFYGAIKKWM